MSDYVNTAPTNVSMEDLNSARLYTPSPDNNVGQSPQISPAATTETPTRPRRRGRPPGSTNRGSTSRRRGNGRQQSQRTEPYQPPPQQQQQLQQEPLQQQPQQPDMLEMFRLMREEIRQENQQNLSLVLQQIQQQSSLPLPQLQVLQPVTSPTTHTTTTPSPSDFVPPSVPPPVPPSVPPPVPPPVPPSSSSSLPPSSSSSLPSPTTTTSPTANPVFVPPPVPPRSSSQSSSVQSPRLDIETIKRKAKRHKAQLTDYQRAQIFMHVQVNQAYARGKAEGWRGPGGGRQHRAGNPTPYPVPTIMHLIEEYYEENFPYWYNQWSSDFAKFCPITPADLNKWGKMLTACRTCASNRQGPSVSLDDSENA